MKKLLALMCSLSLFPIPLFFVNSCKKTNPTISTKHLYIELKKLAKEKTFIDEQDLNQFLQKKYKEKIIFSNLQLKNDLFVNFSINHVKPPITYTINFEIDPNYKLKNNDQLSFDISFRFSQDPIIKIVTNVEEIKIFESLNKNITLILENKNYKDELEIEIDDEKVVDYKINPINDQVLNKNQFNQIYNVEIIGLKHGTSNVIFKYKNAKKIIKVVVDKSEIVKLDDFKDEINGKINDLKKKPFDSIKQAKKLLKDLNFEKIKIQEVNVVIKTNSYSNNLKSIKSKLDKKNYTFQLKFKGKLVEKENQQHLYIIEGNKEREFDHDVYDCIIRCEGINEGKKYLIDDKKFEFKIIKTGPIIENEKVTIESQNCEVCRVVKVSLSNNKEDEETYTIVVDLVSVGKGSLNIKFFNWSNTINFDVVTKESIDLTNVKTKFLNINNKEFINFEDGKTLIDNLIKEINDYKYFKENILKIEKSEIKKQDESNKAEFKLKINLNPEIEKWYKLKDDPSYVRDKTFEMTVYFFFKKDPEVNIVCEKSYFTNNQENIFLKINNREKYKKITIELQSNEALFEKSQPNTGNNNLEKEFKIELKDKENFYSN